jgi:TIR domain/Right handed beta helix region
MAYPIHVFVSHSHKDDDFTVRLVSDLRAAEAVVWVDRTDLAYDEFIKQINAGGSGTQWLVLVLTPDAVVSRYVQREVNAALQHVLDGRMQGVVPVLAKSCDPGSIPVTWATLHRYDATRDYAGARDGLFRTLGLAAPSLGPQVRTVDARGHAQHRTIQQALDAAQDGERIVVRPGRYVEPLHLMKSVEVVGEGSRDHVIVEAEGQWAIAFGAPRGRLENLTIRQRANAQAPRGFATIQQSGGSLEMVDCAVTSAGARGITIESGSLLMRYCTIHDCTVNAVLVAGDGKATLEDCKIVRTNGDAVTVGQRATAILRRNRIVDNTGWGVWVLGTCVAEDNDLRGNHPAWVIVGLGNVTRARNQE